MRFFNKRRGEKGFTLIELLVVIAIIGILATIVLVSLNSARQKARDARRVSDMRQVALALEMYYDDNVAYPAGNGTACTNATWLTMASTIEGGGYMTSVPNDPTNSGSTVYSYGADLAIATDYVVRAYMENPSQNILDSGYTTDEFGCSCDDGTNEYCVTP